MVQLLGEVLPLVAAVLAIPQFAPQFVRLLRLRETTGVSWTGLALTSANNCGWLVYFFASGYTSALPTAAAAAIGAGATAFLLSRLRRTRWRDAIRIAAWGAVLLGVALTSEAAFLGTVLTVAATAQLLPSVWSACRTVRPSGISIGTWLLIVGELTCWGAYGVYQSDPRLIVLGAMGTVSGSLVLGRAIRTGRSGRTFATGRRRWSSSGGCGSSPAPPRPASARHRGPAPPTGSSTGCGG
jgi:uncharacterized protein with PQ loop repeat